MTFHYNLQFPFIEVFNLITILLACQCHKIANKPQSSRYLLNRVFSLFIALCSPFLSTEQKKRTWQNGRSAVFSHLNMALLFI